MRSGLRRAVLLALSCAGLLPALLPAQNLATDLAAGRSLTAPAAEQLETALKANPKDTSARARLLAYYFGRSLQDPAAGAPRLRHMEWLIENDPASPLLGNVAGSLRGADFTPQLARLAEPLLAAWKEQVERHPDDPSVIENAFLSVSNPLDYWNNLLLLDGYYKRLRVLQPGDPEWAFRAVSLYALGLLNGFVPNAPAVSRRWSDAIQEELSKSTDAVVIGLTGAALLQAVSRGGSQRAPETIAIATAVADPLLQRAARLDPKNAVWNERAGSLSSNGNFFNFVAERIQETDLWPSGAIGAMAVPPGAVRMSPQEEATRRPALGPDAVPVGAARSGCHVTFDALLDQSGRVKTLQVAAFDHLSLLNYSFVAAQRNALRLVQYPPMLVNGKPVEVVTQIETACPPAAAPVGVAGSVVGGIPGGLSSAPPPPPPPPPLPPPAPPRVQAPKDASTPLRIAGNVQAAKCVQCPAPVYPPIAKQARIQGSVVFQAIISAEGTVKDLTTIRSANPLLTPAAADAVKKWKYAPTLVNNQPVEVITEVTVNFVLK